MHILLWTDSLWLLDSRKYIKFSLFLDQESERFCICVLGVSIFPLCIWLWLCSESLVCVLCSILLFHNLCMLCCSFYVHISSLLQWYPNCNVFIQILHINTKSEPVKLRLIALFCNNAPTATYLFKYSTLIPNQNPSNSD